jgi:hypothetical protein
MCDPTGGVLTVTLLAAAAGAYAQHDQAKFQERVEKNNAVLAEYQEADAKRRGAIDEEQHRAMVRQILGSQRAAMGANNVVSSMGTPLGLLAETAEQGEFDALKIRNNAANEAWGFGIARNQARARGKQSRRSGTLNAGATLLAGGANAYGYWKKAS